MRDFYFLSLPPSSPTGVSIVEKFYSRLLIVRRYLDDDGEL